MSFIHSIIRSWLLRSTKSFNFTDGYDNHLSYHEYKQLGLYIHIPFCKSICNFCPYCKTLYDKELSERYIEALKQEISLVGDGKKRVTSLYFGGGTPALVADKLSSIINEVSKYFIITDGIGIELHPDNVVPRTLKQLKDAGVTKISIGVQSFQEKFQSLLGRKEIDITKLRNALLEVPFETVSMDFIFALPNQNYNDLRLDLDTAFSVSANHVAIYPFIDFSFTKNTIHSMPNKQKRTLLDQITDYCSKQGFRRTTIWTFANDEKAHYSSMTRDYFLGFGCSAATLLQEQFKINTFSVESYIKRVEEGLLPTSLTLRFSKRQRMLYWLFWTAYSMQVDPKAFEETFGVSLYDEFGLELAIAKRLNLVIDEDGLIKMTKKGAFYYHYYENYYTLSYIDKMWRIMRKEPFPKRITL